ncbi:hypothetical protein MOO45_00320 [Bombilactobacillus folatiphilus]|uniref:Uncharacterized protein n=1 Tax=Bombilactobacillus folatiphilus TaxID=2923362 RepID=A0ABY4P923_9LACO|nr:hypothetical protein [Bombilactobacillus folatiphilus]UQS82178.1 hypothetical protein MOO45_00320 [Bombilactobacillus folatiphilus]
MVQKLRAIILALLLLLPINSLPKVSAATTRATPVNVQKTAKQSTTSDLLTGDNI